MKKYHVAEIPTYCQHRESTDIKDVDREAEESKNVAFEEKIFLSGKKNSAKMMDCFGSLHGIADGQDETDTTFV